MLAATCRPAILRRAWQLTATLERTVAIEAHAYRSSACRHHTSCLKADASPRATCTRRQEQAFSSHRWRAPYAAQEEGVVIAWRRRTGSTRRYAACPSGCEDRARQRHLTCYSFRLQPCQPPDVTGLLHHLPCRPHGPRCSTGRRAHTRSRRSAGEATGRRHAGPKARRGRRHARLWCTCKSWRHARPRRHARWRSAHGRPGPGRCCCSWR